MACRTSGRTRRRTASCASCPARCPAGSSTAPTCQGSGRAPRRSCSRCPRHGCSRTACCRGPRTHAGSLCARRLPPLPPRRLPPKRAPESPPVSTSSIAPEGADPQRFELRNESAVSESPAASRLNLLSPYSFDTERIKSSTHRNLVKVRRLGHGGCTDGAELVAEVEAGRDRQSDPAADAAPHRHVLLAGYLVGNRVTDDARPQTTLPQDLSGGAVDGTKVAVQAAVERESTISNKRSAPVRVRVRDFPYRLAGEEVVLLELAGDAGFLRVHVHVGEHVHRALLRVRALLRLVFHAPVVGRAVRHAGLGRVDRARLLVLAAHGRRAGLRVAAGSER